MVHFLLLCSHTRCLDEIGDAEIAELVENPQSIPRYVWCDHCVTWQPVAELVTAPLAADNVSDSGESADAEPVADVSAAEGNAHTALPCPRLEQNAGTADDAEPRPGVESADSPEPSTARTTGRHRRSSRSEQYAR